MIEHHKGAKNMTLYEFSHGVFRKYAALRLKLFGMFHRYFIQLWWDNKGRFKQCLTDNLRLLVPRQFESSFITIYAGLQTFVTISMRKRFSSFLL